MSRSTLFGTLLALTMPAALLAADANEEVRQAAEMLSAKENYSWTSTITGTRRGEAFEFTVRGNTEKDGYALLTIPRDQGETLIAIKGEQGAVKRDSGWVSLQDLSGDDNPGRFLARMVQSFKAPANEAAELASKVQDLQKSGDSYTGQLTDEAAKELITFRGGRNVTVNNAQGTVKFSVKDGMLSGYEISLQGSGRINDNDVELDRTTKVEISNVGTTKVVVPEEAKSKITR